MVTALVERYLLRYLGEYVVGVDKDHLQVGWSGEIYLRQARLKQEAVELLNLPFRIVFGEVGVLKVSNTLSPAIGASRPLVVELSQLTVWLGPKPESAWSEEEEKRRVQLHRQKVMDKTDVISDLKLGLGENEKGKGGWLAGLMNRIFDNIEINCRDIHFRFEDEAPGGPDGGGTPFSVGLHLASLQAQTTTSSWVPSYTTRTKERGQKLYKSLSVKRLSVYHLHPSWARGGSSASNATLIGGQVEEQDLPDFCRCHSEGKSWEDMFDVLSKHGRVSHILPPVSAWLRLTQSLDTSDASVPNFELSCDIESIKVNISHAGYEGICGIAAFVSEYLAFQEVVRHRIESRRPLRPLVSVLENRQAWWRYAFACVRLSSTATSTEAYFARQPKEGSMMWLLSRDTFQRLKMQSEYCALVRRWKCGQLPSTEEARMHRLGDSLQIADLVRMRSMAWELSKLDLANLDTKSASGSRRPWFSWGERETREASKHHSVSSGSNREVIEEEPDGSQMLDDLVGAADWQGDQVTLVIASGVDPREAAYPCDAERGDGYIFMPSVGSWLQPRPLALAVAPSSTHSHDRCFHLPAVGASPQLLYSPGPALENASSLPSTECEGAIAATASTLMLPAAASLPSPDAVAVMSTSAPALGLVTAAVPLLAALPPCLPAEVAHLPSVGTWMSPLHFAPRLESRAGPRHGADTLARGQVSARGEKCAVAATYSVLEEDLPDAEGPTAEARAPEVDSVPRFVKLPSVGSWLQHAPSAPERADLEDGRPPFYPYARLPSVGTWLHHQCDVEEPVHVAPPTPPRSWLGVFSSWFKRSAAPEVGGSLVSPGGSPPPTKATEKASRPVPVPETAIAPSGVAPLAPGVASARSVSWLRLLKAAPASDGFSASSRGGGDAPADVNIIKSSSSGSTEAGAAVVSEAAPIITSRDLAVEDGQQPKAEVNLFDSAASATITVVGESVGEATLNTSSKEGRATSQATPGTGSWLTSWLGRGTIPPAPPALGVPLDGGASATDPGKEGHHVVVQGVSEASEAHVLSPSSPKLSPKIPAPTASPHFSLWPNWLQRGSPVQDGTATESRLSSSQMLEVLGSQAATGGSPYASEHTGGDAFAFSALLAPPPEPPLLKLLATLPQVVVELQTHEQARTIFAAKRQVAPATAEGHKDAVTLTLTVSQKDEMALNVDILNVGLTSYRRSGRRFPQQHEIETRLIYVQKKKVPVSEAPCVVPSGSVGSILTGSFRAAVGEDPHEVDALDDESDSAVLSVEYMSEDRQGEPSINVRGGKGLTIFLQREALNEIANFFLLPGGKASTGVATSMGMRKDISTHSRRSASKELSLTAKRTFDDWRRKAKSLLYSRGRPRICLHLEMPTLVLPTRTWRPGCRLAERAPVLVLRPEYVEAFSEEVTEKERKPSAVGADVDLRLLLRSDKWTVNFSRVRIQRFPSHEEVLKGGEAACDVVSGFSLEMSCFLRKYALSVRCGRPSATAHSMHLGGRLLNATCLVLDAQNYDAIIRTIRLLLKRYQAVHAKAPEAGQPASVEVASIGELGRPCTEAVIGEAVPVSSTVNLELDLGSLAIRFHCFPDRLQYFELCAYGGELHFDCNEDACNIKVNMSRMDMLHVPLPEEPMRLVRADVTRDTSPLMIAITSTSVEARETLSEGAEMLIRVALGKAHVAFSPAVIRQLVTFAKSTPASEFQPDISEEKASASNNLLYRLYVDFDDVDLVWVDESSGLHFAQSHMTTPSILLDLHYETVGFRGRFLDFDIQDLTSVHKPIILQPCRSGREGLEITARTFSVGSPEFVGHNTAVSVNFASFELTYMGKKFMRCWSWVMGSFLPALTASGQPRESEGSEDDDGSVSFKSIPEEDQTLLESDLDDEDVDAQTSPVRRYISVLEDDRPVFQRFLTGVSDHSTIEHNIGLRRLVTGSSENSNLDNVGQDVPETREPHCRERGSSSKSPIDSAKHKNAPTSPVSPMEASRYLSLTEAEGEEGRKKAWAVAEELARQARSDSVQRFMHLRVVLEGPVVITLPVSVSGASAEPHARLEVGRVVATNAPCHDTKLGLVDVLTFDFEAARLSTSDGFEVLGKHGMSVRLDRPLHEGVMPMRVLWRAPRPPFALAPSAIALLRGAFSENIAGEDPDVATPPQTEAALEMAKSGVDAPIWLEMKLRWSDVCLRLVEDGDAKGRSAYATLEIRDMDMQIKKHAAPAVRVRCGLRGTLLRCTSSLQPTDLVISRGCTPLHHRYQNSRPQDSPYRRAPDSSEETKSLDIFVDVLRGGSVPVQMLRVTADQPRVLVSLAIFGKLGKLLSSPPPKGDSAALSNRAVAEPEPESIMKFEFRNATVVLPLQRLDSQQLLAFHNTAVDIENKSRHGVNRWSYGLHRFGIARCEELAALDVLERPGFGDQSTNLGAPSMSGIRSLTEAGFEAGISLTRETTASNDQSISLQRRTCKTTFKLQPLALRLSDQDVRLCALIFQDILAKEPEADPQGACEDAGASGSVVQGVIVPESPVEHTFRIDVKRLTFMALTDQGHSNKMPFLYLRLSDVLMVKKPDPSAKLGAESSVGACVALDFFNPTAACWEPLLEGTRPPRQHLMSPCPSAYSQGTPTDRPVRQARFQLPGDQAPSEPSQTAVIESVNAHGFDFICRKSSTLADGLGAKASDRLTFDASNGVLLTCSDMVLRVFIAQHRGWMAFLRGSNLCGPSSTPPPMGTTGDEHSFAPYSVRNATGQVLRIRYSAPRRLGHSADADPRNLLHIPDGEEECLTDLRVQTSPNSTQSASSHHSVSLLVCRRAGATGGSSFDEVYGVPLDRVGSYVFCLVKRASSFPGMDAFTHIGSASYPNFEALHSHGRGVGLRDRTSFENLRSARHESPTEMADAGPYVICRVEVTNDHKVLVVESPVTVVNELGVEVRISVNGRELAKSVPSGVTVCLPVSECQHGGFRLKPVNVDAAWSEEFKFGWLEYWPHHLPFHFVCMNNYEVGRHSGSFGYGSAPFCCCSQRSCETIPYGNHMAKKHTIRLRAPVTIHSTLPVPLHWRVFIQERRSKAVWRDKIEAGSCSRLCGLQLTTSQISLQLSVGDAIGRWSDPVRIWTGQYKLLSANAAETAEQVVQVPTARGSRSNRDSRLAREPEHHLRVQLLFQSSPGEPLQVVVHAPTWLVDHVHSPSLQFSWCLVTGAAGSGSCAVGCRPGEVQQENVNSQSQPIELGFGGNMAPIDCEATHIVVSLRSDDLSAKPVSLRALGSETISVQSRTHPHIKRGETPRFDLSVHRVDRVEACGLVVRLLHLVPARVVVNACDQPLRVRQAAPANSPFHNSFTPSSPSSLPASRLLVPGDRLPFHWADANAPPQLQICIGDNETEGSAWQWSSALRCDSVEEYAFQVWRDSPHAFQNLRLEVRLVEATSFVIIRRDNPSLAAHEIQNSSSEAISFKQQHTESPHIELQPGASTPFAWNDPFEKARRLEVFIMANPHKSVGTASFERVEKYLAVGKELRYIVNQKGPTMKLTFIDHDAETPEKEDEKELFALPHLEVKVRLPYVGVSVVMPLSVSMQQRAEQSLSVRQRGAEQAHVRSELLLVSIWEISVKYIRSERHDAIEAQLQELQIDNQRGDAPHPVVLARPNKNGMKEPQRKLPPLLQLKSRRRLHPDILYFDQLTVELSGNLDLRLDDGLLRDFADLWEGVLRDMLAAGGSGDDSPGLATDIAAIAAKDAQRESLRLHFRLLNLKRMSASLTFSGNAGLPRPQEQRGRVSFIHRLAIAVASVDNFTITLDALKMKHRTMPAASLKTAVVEHYKNEVISRIFRDVVFSLELLGNPRGCWTHIREGCQALCDVPYAGASLSVEDALEGLINGVGSCFSNILFGACHSLAGCSGTASHGCAVCLTDDVRLRRQARRQAPKRILSLSFLRMASKTLTCGLAEALGGLVINPALGCRREGIRGFLRGCGSGTLGLVLNPVISCLDVTRYTSAQISAHHEAKLKVNDIPRDRALNPRVVYGPERTLRPYSHADAEIKALLQSSDTTLGGQAIITYVRDPDGPNVIVVTEALVLLVDNLRQKILVRRPLMDVAAVYFDERSGCVIMHLRNGGATPGVRRSRAGGEGNHVELRLSSEGAMRRAAAFIESALPPS